MQRMSQRWFAAIAAVLGVAGLASAQSAPPSALPVIPYPPIQPVQAVPYQPVVPVQGIPSQMPQTVPQQMPYQPIQPIQAAPAAQSPVAIAMPGTPGCSTCGNNSAQAGTYPSPYLPQRTTIGAGLAPVPYNEYCPQCANGCGSIKSDFGFIFGSCKSFFNPCGPIPCNGLGGTGGGCLGKCGSFPYGKPYGNGYNNCVYDSYLNH